jgi:hypothetical protein
MSTGTVRIALLLAAPLLAVPLFAACKSGLPASQGEHWKLDSVPSRMAKHFTGFRADRDGRFIDYQYEKKKSLSKTMRRHFANNSPDSPFEPDDPSQTKRRPPHSIWPDPVYYMGLESVFIGAATLGITGVFVPLPFDSLVATGTDVKNTLTNDEKNEFKAGFTGDSSALNPPSVNEFRVRNR